MTTQNRYKKVFTDPLTLAVVAAGLGGGTLGNQLQNSRYQQLSNRLDQLEIARLGEVDLSHRLEQIEAEHHRLATNFTETVTGIEFRQAKLLKEHPRVIERW